jgi:hypothetical protein
MNKIIVKLSAGYYIGMAFFCVCWGLGLIIHFTNNRVFPKIIDDEGITTRSGKRHLWSELIDWERQRLVAGSTYGPRITGNFTLFFKKGKVRIGSFPIENLNEVLTFVSQKLFSEIGTG